MRHAPSAFLSAVRATEICMALLRPRCAPRGLRGVSRGRYNGRYTGTLQYEIYFNDDQSECIVLERYSDSEAFIEHGAHLGELAEAILATGSVTSACLGEPSAQLRAQLAGSAVQLFTPYLSL